MCVHERQVEEVCAEWGGGCERGGWGVGLALFNSRRVSMGGVPQFSTRSIWYMYPCIPAAHYTVRRGGGGGRGG